MKEYKVSKVDKRYQEDLKWLENLLNSGWRIERMSDLTDKDKVIVVLYKEEEAVVSMVARQNEAMDIISQHVDEGATGETFHEWESCPCDLCEALRKNDENSF